MYFQVYVAGGVITAQSDRQLAGRTMSVFTHDIEPHRSSSEGAYVLPRYVLCTKKPQTANRWKLERFGPFGPPLAITSLTHTTYLGNFTCYRCAYGYNLQF